MSSNTLVLTAVFAVRTMLATPFTAKWAFRIYCNIYLVRYDDPKWYSRFKSDIALHIHDDIAVHFGLPVCRYCRWIVEPSFEHKACLARMDDEKIADEIRLAWEEYYALQDREIELAEYESESDDDDLDDWNDDDFDDGEDESGYEGNYTIPPYGDFDDEEAEKFNWLDEFDDGDDGLDDVCNCGHPARQHGGSYGQDHCMHCACQYFDQSPDQYQDVTKVYLGDPGDEGGFIAYE